MAHSNMNGYINRRLAEQLNDEFREAVMPVTVLVGIEIVVGFFGNLLVLYVFLFRYHVCNFRFFVLSMAFIDFLSTLTTMPGEIVTQLYWYVYPYRMMCKVKSLFNMFTVSAEALCLLVIAIDRFRKVCYPFGWQIRPKIAILLCGLIYTTAFILALPTAFLWGVHHHTIVYNNMTVVTTICEKDDQFDGTDRPLHYSHSMQALISICLVVMFVLYVFIAKTLVARRRNRTGAKIKVVISPTLSSHPVFFANVDYELNSKGDTSDAGYSSGAEGQPTKPKYNYISSDGGLTTDEEEVEEATSPNLLTVPGLNSPRLKPMPIQTKSDPIKSRKKMGARVRRKTKIMMILTILFIFTTILYLTLLSLIADDILEDMSDAGKAVYFLAFRLYFMNHVINPILYGFLDPNFQKVMKQMKKKIFGKK